eukprot:356269-Chlamydomonas_euryale.AAC.6
MTQRGLCTTRTPVMLYAHEFPPHPSPSVLPASNPFPPLQAGICPQHDTLWGPLTAREHLMLYARLKGLLAAPRPGRRAAWLCAQGGGTKEEARPGGACKTGGADCGGVVPDGACKAGGIEGGAAFCGGVCMPSGTEDEACPDGKPAAGDTGGGHSAEVGEVASGNKAGCGGAGCPYMQDAWQQPGQEAGQRQGTAGFRVNQQATSGGARKLERCTCGKPTAGDLDELRRAVEGCLEAVQLSGPVADAPCSTYSGVCGTAGWTCNTYGTAGWKYNTFGTAGWTCNTFGTAGWTCNTFGTAGWTCKNVRQCSRPATQQQWSNVEIN